METARETAQRVVARLLDGEAQPKTEIKPDAQPRFEARQPGPLRRPMQEAKAGTGVKKAWKKGKAMSGQAVASKPGKVSYRESLIQNALRNIKARQGDLAEKMGTGSGMKGAKGKKNVGTVAKKPGSVGYGKR